MAYNGHDFMVLYEGYDTGRSVVLQEIQISGHKDELSCFDYSYHCIHVQSYSSLHSYGRCITACTCFRMCSYSLLDTASGLHAADVHFFNDMGDGSRTVFDCKQGLL